MVLDFKLNNTVNSDEGELDGWWLIYSAVDFQFMNQVHHGCAFTVGTYTPLVVDRCLIRDNI